MKRDVTVLIVDDHPLFRRGLREVVEESSHFKIVAEASDGEEALRLVLESKPKIAVIDIDMPRLNGLEMVRAIRKLELPVTPIFLTMYKEEDMFNAAMDLGVKAYVLKENAADDILAALESAARGDIFVSPPMLEMNTRRSSRVQQLLLSKPQIDDLTPAERRVLKLIAEDHTTKEIADLLRISARTVENHRLNICQKLNLHGSHSLLRFAFDHKSFI
jgi:two-component system, NarL family, response regulator DegU